MTKRMLIDSTHAEETRVVVLDGNRLEDYDVETSTKQQLKGNIYLAKIVRVEPSLQAAFVEFGGGRHGFLAFGEIHPDYYQIPVADRKRLLEMQEEEAREEEEAEEREAVRSERRGRRDRPAGADAAPETLLEAAPDATPDIPADDGIALVHDAVEDAPDDQAQADAQAAEPGAADALIEAGYATQADPEAAEDALPRPDQVAQALAVSQDIMVAPEEAQALFPEPDASPDEPSLPAGAAADSLIPAEGAEATQEADAPQGDLLETVETAETRPEPESLGGEHDTEDRPDRRTTPRFLRNYKIQEVMRRRQILLVQVVKEERGTKGAALTTYISLAGRFSVLMPNSPRGGGISRKITSAADRRRLKEITAELDLPRGMGLIVRTAGANRPRPEIIRDCEYLLNQWDQIRDLTMKSMAPALIYEEASLIKRAIRDVYSRDVDDILVDGEEGWRAARDFMRMLMPTHAKKVQLWKDPQPLFAKAQVEQQLDSMLQPNVQLRSGGYLVINQTEALVAIDVNSGRSTRERGIEETALRTNLEAAEEAARQLRLRDLAGLIVIDFIDMESRRNNAAVEKKLKDALKNDRARIQIGSISHFGLLEMSRQRLRPSLAETSFVTCPHCGGTGHVRGTESAALAVLRGIEDEGAKRRAAEIVVHVAGAVAFYILNHKRLRLSEIEQRFGLHVSFSPDESLRAPDMRIERVRAQTTSELPAPISQLAPPEPFVDPDEEILSDATEEEEEAAAEAEAAPGTETAEESEQRGKKRRRRRRGGRRDDATPGAEGAEDDADEAVEAGATAAPEAGTPPDAVDGDQPSTGGEAAEAPADAPGDTTAEDADRKRRGRRGGRRRRRGDATTTEGADGDAVQPGQDAEEGPDPVAAVPAIPAYVGPTPADPFGGANTFDFFDAVEQAEQERALQAQPRAVTEPTPAEAIAPEPAAPEPEADVPEPAPASTATEPQAPEPVAAETATTEPAAAEASHPVAEAPAAEPSPADEEPVPASQQPTASQPAAEQSMAEPVAAEPEPVETATTGRAEPVVAPPIAPTLIGATGDAPAEKKRGWWRR